MKPIMSNLPHKAVCISEVPSGKQKNKRFTDEMV
jgi:hypothetical protein